MDVEDSERKLLPAAHQSVLWPLAPLSNQLLSYLVTLPLSPHNRQPLIHLCPDVSALFSSQSVRCILRTSAYVTLDLDMILSARFLASPGFQPFQVTRNYDGYYRFSGFSSYECHFELGGMQQHECNRLATPINDTANAHAFLDVAILC